MQQTYSRRRWLRRSLDCVGAALVALTLCGCASHGGDASTMQPGSAATATALPSWRDGAARQAILKFVADVTREGSPTFVPPADRIAVFDNDGTLWSEQPLYFQFIFMLDQVKAAAPNHPEWKNNPAFKALIAHDYAALASQQKPLLQLVAAANSGMTVDDYDQDHPRLARQSTASEIQPPLYRSGVSAATRIARLSARQRLQDLHRLGRHDRIHAAVGREGLWHSARAGDRLEPGSCKYELRDGQPVLVRLPKIDFVDDGPGKPVGIYRNIGRKPILAFGNSDGDLQMLQYTACGSGGISRLLRASRRRRARIRVRPRVEDRQARQGVGRSGRRRLDRGQHEGRLANDLSRAEAVRRHRGEPEQREPAARRCGRHEATRNALREA